MPPGFAKRVNFQTKGGMLFFQVGHFWHIFKYLDTVYGIIFNIW